MVFLKVVFPIRLGETLVNIMSLDVFLLVRYENLNALVAVK